MSIQVSYPLKLEQTDQLQQSLTHLKTFGTQLYNELMNILWNTQTLDALEISKLKAFKIIGESVIDQTPIGSQLYLPSRMKRAMVEQVGRVIRSQCKRRNCWYDIFTVIKQTGLGGKLDSLVKTVFLTLSKFHGKYYKLVLIRQHLRTLRRLHFSTGIDIDIIETLEYTHIVKPQLKNFLLPYSGDDGFEGQIVKIDTDKKIKHKLHIKLKVPVTPYPLTRKDWTWLVTEVSFPSKIFSKLESDITKIHLPSLRYLTLQGDLELPFLEFSLSLRKNTTYTKHKQKVMATDLGIINLSSSVIFYADQQISTPYFFNVNKRILTKIDRLYGHISKLQKKLAKYKPHWIGQKRRQKEYDRLTRKTNRLRLEIIHLVSNHLLDLALSNQVSTIVLEDLRGYEPPKTKRKLSRILSQWLRGWLYDVLIYKAKQFGISVKRINPRNTSSYCPRCAMKGHKIIEPTLKKVSKTGRFFYCTHCQYIADRDYIAALNIFRKWKAKKKKIYSMSKATAISYTGLASHSTVSGGKTSIITG